METSGPIIIGQVTTQCVEPLPLPRRLAEFAKQQRKQGWRLGNILIVDYWEHLSDVVNLAIELSTGENDSQV